MLYCIFPLFLSDGLSHLFIVLSVLSVSLIVNKFAPMDSLCLLPEGSACIPVVGTVCPRSSDPFYIVNYYIKWVSTSLTYSMYDVPGHKSKKELTVST